MSHELCKNGMTFETYTFQAFVDIIDSWWVSFEERRENPFHFLSGFKNVFTGPPQGFLQIQKMFSNLIHGRLLINTFGSDIRIIGQVFTTTFVISCNVEFVHLFPGEISKSLRKDIIWSSGGGGIWTSWPLTGIVVPLRLKVFFYCHYFFFHH